MFPISRILQYGNVLPSTNLIKKVQANSFCVMALTTSGNLYVIGRLAAAGVGSTGSTATWVLSNTNVSDLWTYQGNGSTGVLIVKNDGTWYSTGNSIGITGTGSSTTWVDRTSFMNAAFTSSSSSYKQISFNSTNLAVVLQNGDLYLSGTNASGQIGDGTTTTKTVLTKSSKTGIIQAQCSSAPNIFALNSSGTVWGAGVNNVYQLNTTSTTGNITTFATVTTGGVGLWVGDNYSSASCAVYISKNDGLYSAGSNANGEQGYTANSGRNLLTKNTSLVPVEIWPGISNVHFKTNTGDIYFAGSNNYTSGISGLSTPNIVSYTSVPDMKNATSIAHGTNKTAYCVRSNTLYGCGTYNATYNFLPNYGSDVQTVSKLNIDGIS